MSVFSDKLKGLLNPCKDKEINAKFNKINEELEISISKSLDKGYDFDRFIIPKTYRYMCKEALLNISENLEKEGYKLYVKDKHISTQSPRTYRFFYLVASSYDSDQVPSYTNTIDNAKKK